MGNFNPSGISSQIKIEGKLFHLQTEFAPRPKPRITTSIILNGETVHKIDNLWEEPLETEEEKEKIESFLRKQHETAVKFTKENAADFIKAEETEVIKKEPKSIFSDLWKRISNLEGIENLTAISQDGSVFYSEKGDQFASQISPLAVNCNRFANFLSQISRLGEFEGGVVEANNKRIAFINYRKSIFALALKSGKDLNELLAEVKGVLKE
jgi:hypothetical protein